MAIQQPPTKTGPASIGVEAVGVAARNVAGTAKVPIRADDTALGRSAAPLGRQAYDSPGLFDLIDGPELHGVSVGSGQDVPDSEVSTAVEASGSSAQEQYRQTLDRFRGVTQRAARAAHQREALLMEVVRVAGTAAVPQADLARDLALRPDQVSRLVATLGMLDRQPGAVATARRNHPERFSLSHLTPLLPLDAADQDAILIELTRTPVTVRELRRRARLCMPTGGLPAHGPGGRHPHAVTHIATLADIRRLLRGVTAVEGTARHRPPAADGTRRMELRISLTLPVLVPRLSAEL
ncbi:MAG: hypothetical protein ACYCZN_04685 [Candidatus Dormibacteria bacterium]